MRSFATQACATTSRAGCKYARRPSHWLQEMQKVVVGQVSQVETIAFKMTEKVQLTKVAPVWFAREAQVDLL